MSFKDKKIISLYESKENCCGCGVCMNACPRDAIVMEEDEVGNVFPRVIEEKCIVCGMCINVCGYKRKIEEHEPMEVFVASAMDEEILKTSSSGGVFFNLAQETIVKGGKVFGCALNDMYPEHIGIEKKEDIYKLQGSKYVQSDCKFVFREVKKELKQNRFVLFTGTPCQVSSLKKYLEGMDCSRLTTVDIVCHGVPNRKMFQEYIKVLENRWNVKLEGYLFRDKIYGWGLVPRVYYLGKDGNMKFKNVNEINASFYSMFLDGIIYRENCYSCPYAKRERVADITIGDYWGIEKEHPEYLKENGGRIDSQKGVSVVLVNTPKGRKMCEEISDRVILLKSTYIKASSGNGQLKKPCEKNLKRKEALSAYETGGYYSLEKWYKKDKGIRMYFRTIKKSLLRKRKS